MRSSPQRFWRHLALSHESVQHVVADEKIITDYTEAAERYNEYFHSVFVPLGSSLPTEAGSAEPTVMENIIHENKEFCFTSIYH